MSWRPTAAALTGGTAALVTVYALAAGGPARAILVDKLAFGPAPASLRVGDTVEWVNHDMFLHSATASDHSFDVELKPNGEARVRLTRAGVIAYVCRYHPAMTGKLVVHK